MRLVSLLILALSGAAWAQPFSWPHDYVPTVSYGGIIRQAAFAPEENFSLNPAVSQDPWLALVAGPPLVYRDWLGNRSYRRPDGGLNLFFALEVEELELERDFIVTLRQGWRWSDGAEITAADAMTARLIQGDPAVEGNRFHCSEIDGEPIRYEQLGRYRYRITLPRPRVNALADDCGFLPTHVFLPVYEREGAEGVKRLWDEATDVGNIVSGGPYVFSEVRPGERVVLARNPLYGESVKAADGSPLPGPDGWVFVASPDAAAQLSAAVTGQLDVYRPHTLEEVRAVQEALERGVIQGSLHANIGPGKLVEFITYNFNATDPCKRGMFRDVRFRRAVSLLIDRSALVEAGLGGLGFPAKDFNSAAAAPFDAPHLGPLPFDPQRGVALLREMGFTRFGPDGVLANPETGCRADFDLMFNASAEVRGRIVQVISQTLAPYGVKVNARQVSNEMWGEAILGESLPRRYDSDAILWGLGGGDLDNLSFSNGLRLAAELNAWNKSKTDVQPWEILMDRLTVELDSALELGTRVAIYNERAELMREYLPITPLVSPAFHFFHNLENVWPASAMDAFSLEDNPGNFPANVMKP